MKQCFYIILVLIFAKSYGQGSLLEKGEKYTYTQQDSAYYYFDKAYEESLSNKDWTAAIEALMKSNASSSYFDNYKKFKSSLKKGEKLFSKLPDTIDYLPDGITYLKNRYLHDKGRYHYKLNNYRKSISSYFKMLDLLDKLPDSILKKHYSSFATTANSYIASMYQQEFKYTLAEEFYNENLRLHKKFNHSNEKVYQTMNLIASLKSEQKDYIYSNNNAKKSIAFYLNKYPNKNLNSLLSSSLLIINNYIKLKQPDSARIYLNKVQKFIPKRKKFISDFRTATANIYVLEKDYEKALNLYENIIKELSLQENNGDDIALVYKDIGDLYFLKGNMEKSILFYQKGFHLFNPKVKLKENNLKLPRAYDKPNIFKILNALTKTNNTIGEKKDYHNTITNGFFTIEELNDLKVSFYDDTDKQVLIEHVIPIFENAIFAAYQLYNETKDNTHIKNAFTFFENSKSTIILDAIYKNNASQFSGLPESILEQEKILKLTIADLERTLQKAGTEVEQLLFEKKREHQQLIKNLELNHPEYYNLKYNTTITSLNSVRKSLNKNQGVFSYFYGTNAIYAISISKNSEEFIRIPLDSSIENSMQKLNSLIANPTSSIEKVHSISAKVYQKILQPLIWEKQFSSLIIIPDGLINYLPFEILRDRTGYLIEKTTISYSNSATLLEKLKSQENYENTRVLAFAPEFTETEASLGLNPLPNNQTEVKGILSHFKGKSYLGKNASLLNFANENKHYGIIHLATHAVVNDETPEYSYLAFTPSKDTESLLFINDLYAIQLKANLVTLSACETGVGELKKGEGAISLARAFFYSGAQSLVNTLWRINDRSTAEIMENFYKIMADGKPKDIALREAKLSFLKKNKENNLSHPYYWSSFVLHGNSNPLPKKHPWMWYTLCLGILGIFLIFRKKLLKLF